MIRVPVLCDLDGVVWLARRAIAGSVDAIAALRAAGHRVIFVTNNSWAVVADQEAALAAIGVPAVGDVLTSAMAAARLVQPGERVLVLGGPGIVEALGRRDVEVVERGPCDAVLVGFTWEFDYELLRTTVEAVRAGGRLIGTNDDATYPTPEGLIPGGGAILAAVSTAAEVEPVIAGKPHAPMADLVREEVGLSPTAMRSVVMVGDRPSTDGLFARRLGCRFAQVWSGVTLRDGTPAGSDSELVADDLAGIASLLLSECASDQATDR